MSGAKPHAMSNVPADAQGRHWPCTEAQIVADEVMAHLIADF
jgi:hypothetical protein